MSRARIRLAILEEHTVCRVAEQMRRANRIIFHVTCSMADLAAALEGCPEIPGRDEEADREAILNEHIKEQHEAEQRGRTVTKAEKEKNARETAESIYDLLMKAGGYTCAMRRPEVDDARLHGGNDGVRHFKAGPDVYIEMHLMMPMEP